MRPVTLENLKPWREAAGEVHSVALRVAVDDEMAVGWLVYLQTLMASMGPNAPGR